VRRNRLPSNCQFEVDDYEANWTYSRPFDYIHGRELAGAVKDFGRLSQQAFEHLTSGGYFEMQSLRIEVFADDDSLNNAPFTKQMAELIQEAASQFGKPMANMDEWPDKLTETGFTDVVCKIKKVPISPWPKDPKLRQIGKYFQVQQEQGFQSHAPQLLTKVLGWSDEEVAILIAHAVAELKNLSVHQYGKLYLVYGKKP
jgi:hypothetical protein